MLSSLKTTSQAHNPRSKDSGKLRRPHLRKLRRPWRVEDGVDMSQVRVMTLPSLQRLSAFLSAY